MSVNKDKCAADVYQFIDRLARRPYWEMDEAIRRSLSEWLRDNGKPRDTPSAPLSAPPPWLLPTEYVPGSI